MPLINFKTDLTTLRYGLDQPGGGSSGLPYVQFPIDNANTPTAIKRYYEINRTSLDFPIRGGALNALQNGTFSPVSSTVDRELIEKFLASSPRGKAFIDKQKGLQLTNPRTQVPNTVTFAGLSLGNVVIPVTQTYNPLNTLAQVQVQGTGAHFNYMGQFPRIAETIRETYEFIAGAPQNNTPATNRLLILKSLKLDLQNRFNPSFNDILGSGVDNLALERLGISPISNQLFNYPGGPGSVYGIGNTRIFRVTNTQPLIDPVTQTPYSTIAFSYAQIANQKTYDIPTSVRIQDFRELLSTGSLVPSTDYFKRNIARPSDGEGGLGIGNPGGPLLTNDVLTTKPGAQDSLNALNPFYYNANSQDPWEAGGNNTKDIIKFMFECLSNDSAGFAVALPFRAFMDGTITDTNQAQYDTFKYLGRGETFRTYQGFERSISFSFKIFPQTRSEMKPLYTKLNALVSQVYPDYSPSSKLMRGNVVRLTIGDYIYRMPGFLESVDISIDNSNTPWEIQLYGIDAESDVAQLPQLISVSCTFKPIMDILPARVTNSNQNVPLIANNGSFLGNIKDVSQPPIKTPDNFWGGFPENTQITPSQVSGTEQTTNPNVITDKVKKQVVAQRRLAEKQARQAALRGVRAVGENFAISPPVFYSQNSAISQEVFFRSQN